MLFYTSPSEVETVVAGAVRKHNGALGGVDTEVLPIVDRHHGGAEVL